MSWRTLLTSFPIKDFLKPCLVGRLALNVLMATSSKFSSISLNISQYLSEYIFRVFPSRMVIDNRESKGWGTLLHVIKRDPNTRVSSLKESIEPAPRPSNHLITTGPKLDGNTLHIKDSFLECTTILWLKWLTCSAGFIRPLYMMNVGGVNYQGSLPPSILRVKGDLEIWFNALLIASFPKPLQDELLFLCSRWLSSSHEKNSLGGPWPGSIIAIPIIIRRKIRIGRSSPSPFGVQSPFQTINFQLHGSSVFFMRDMTPTSRMTPIGMGGMHTNLLVPSLLKIEEMILTLGPHGFLSVRTWTYHNWTLNSLQHKNFPQTAPIVRTWFGS